MTENSGYTSFEVFPLYNEYDKFEFAVVEFEPRGYLGLPPFFITFGNGVAAEKVNIKCELKSQKRKSTTKDKIVA